MVHLQAMHRDVDPNPVQESHRPTMATVLAAPLMVNEVPQLTDFAGAVSEERE